MNKTEIFYYEEVIRISRFRTHGGNGFVIVTGSNLATIKNSVQTIASIVQDWLPNFLQSLQSE